MGTNTLLSRELTSMADTVALAVAVAEILPPGGVLLLKGNLGAGKTTFVQALARCYKITRTVTSPTFTLVNEYPMPTGERLVHCDLYRLASPEGFYDLGLDEAMARGDRLAIEWPERAQEILDSEAPHRWVLTLTLTEEGTRQAVLVEET